MLEVGDSFSSDSELRFVNGDGVEFGVNGLSDGEKLLLIKVFPLFMGGMEGRVILIFRVIPIQTFHLFEWKSYGSKRR